MIRKLCHVELWYKHRHFNAFTSFIVSNCTVRHRSKFRMPKPGYYAVRVGRIPGIYTNWGDCESQVKGFPNAVYKKFPSIDLANNYINGGSTIQQPQNKSFPNAVVQKIPSLDFANNFMKAGSSVQNRQVKKEARKIINEIDSNEFDLPDDNFWLDCDFDEAVTPVITSVSDLTTVVPKIIYPSSSKGCYYAVHRGKVPGVYKTWTECSLQIQDYRNASYRKFDNEQEAFEYFRTGGIQKASKRELRFLEINNKVKRRRLDDSNNYEYALENPEDTVVVFTDGASSENGKRRSRAGIGVYWGRNHPLNTSKRITGRQTNNRAEIYAAVHALNQAKLIGAKKVSLYTDSQFVIHAITDWIKKWQANGWKLVTGKEVVNKEDFIALSAAQETLDVEWIYVKAHARNEGNDQADALAVAGSKLLLQPENCSEFQNVEVSTNLGQKDVEPFLLTNSSSTSEKIMPLIIPDVTEKKSFYAVHRGNNPGVYLTWTECEQQINNFAKPYFRKFDSEEEAKEFVRTGEIMKKKFKIPEYKEDEFVTVFTDGASSSNGNEDARAGIGVYWGPGNALNSSMRLPGRQTNNCAEIYAAVHALRQAKQLGIKNVRLYTDSQFVIKGITTWIKKWKENDWKSANGKPVVNKTDFMALELACDGLNVDWCYVKGHDNNPGNVEADQLAVAGCNKSLSDTLVLA